MRTKRILAKVAIWILIIAAWIIYGNWIVSLTEVSIWTVGGILSLLGVIGAFIGLVVLTVIAFFMSL